MQTSWRSLPSVWGRSNAHRSRTDSVPFLSCRSLMREAAPFGSSTHPELLRALFQCDLAKIRFYLTESERRFRRRSSRKKAVRNVNAFSFNSQREQRLSAYISLTHEWTCVKAGLVSALFTHSTYCVR